ncbi:Regulator of G-protein signaling 4 [Balamuthia mandrillaris]
MSSRSISLQQILVDKELKQVFKRFCNESFAGENVACWEAIQEYKTLLSQDDRMMKAKEILARFIRVNAEEEVNIELEEKQRLEHIITAGSDGEPAHLGEDIFKPTLDAIVILMQNDSYHKFFRSKLYEEYQNQKPEPTKASVAFMAEAPILEKNDKNKGSFRERIKEEEAEAGWFARVRKKGKKSSTLNNPRKSVNSPILVRSIAQSASGAGPVAQRPASCGLQGEPIDKPNEEKVPVVLPTEQSDRSRKNSLGSVKDDSYVDLVRKDLLARGRSRSRSTEQPTFWVSSRSSEQKPLAPLQLQPAHSAPITPEAPPRENSVIMEGEGEGEENKQLATVKRLTPRPYELQIGKPATNAALQPSPPSSELSPTAKSLLEQQPLAEQPPMTPQQQQLQNIQQQDKEDTSPYGSEASLVPMASRWAPAGGGGATSQSSEHFSMFRQQMLEAFLQRRPTKSDLKSRNILLNEMKRRSARSNSIGRVQRTLLERPAKSSLSASGIVCKIRKMSFAEVKAEMEQRDREYTRRTAPDKESSPSSATTAASPPQQESATRRSGSEEIWMTFLVRDVQPWINCRYMTEQRRTQRCSIILMKMGSDAKLSFMGGSLHRMDTFKRGLKRLCYEELGLRGTSLGAIGVASEKNNTRSTATEEKEKEKKDGSRQGDRSHYHYHSRDRRERERDRESRNKKTSSSSSSSRRQQIEEDIEMLSKELEKEREKMRKQAMQGRMRLDWLVSHRFWDDTRSSHLFVCDLGNDVEALQEIEGTELGSKRHGSLNWGLVRIPIFLPSSSTTSNSNNKEAADEEEESSNTNNVTLKTILSYPLSDLTLHQLCSLIYERGLVPREEFKTLLSQCRPQFDTEMLVGTPGYRPHQDLEECGC